MTVMTEATADKNTRIALVGHMGAGKSAIGKSLRQSTSWTLFDLDKLIVHQSQMSINKIFETQGEPAFRALESELLQEVLESSEPFILATGGGVILSEHNRALLKQATVVYLYASFEVIYDRIEGSSQRPLLKVDDPHAKLKKLFKQRGALYESCADLTINTENLSISQIAHTIEAELCI